VHAVSPHANGAVSAGGDPSEQPSAIKQANKAKRMIVVEQTPCQPVLLRRRNDEQRPTPITPTSMARIGTRLVEDGADSLGTDLAL
jgi:hypothetical protein